MESTTDNSVPMNALNKIEMDNQEREVARMIEVFMRAYLDFPSSRNFDLVLERMRDYQTAWMNGRGGPRP